MKAIQLYLPNPRHTEVMRIFLNATPQAAWERARHYDVYSVPWVRALFKLRTLAESFHEHGTPIQNNHVGFIDEIAQNNKGFIILHEVPGKEVVVGAIGKFWHVDIPFQDVTSQTFQSFQQPGWGKVAWSITVEPCLAGCTLCFELRTATTDNLSWKKLNRYYHIIGSFSRLIRHTFLGRLEQELGTLELPHDNTIQLPGDEILPFAKYADTNHINIEAPPAIVWRYLMQLGCDRAGWYSIDALDNGGAQSTDHLLSQWADRQVGDRLAATPKQDSFFEVYQVEHEKHFVIGGAIQKNDNYFKSTWAFVLQPIGEDATHLIVRAKFAMSPQWKEWFMGHLFYPLAHGIMEAVQLKTIRRYAERDARVGTETHVPGMVVESEV